MYSFQLEKHEIIVKKDHANYYDNENIFTGALYLTSERVVFVGYLMDLNSKTIEEIPLAHIEKAVSGRSLFIIPNVLYLETIRGKKLKFVVKGRDEWISAIRSQIVESS